MIREADTDGDGQINYDEFVKVCHPHSRQMMMSKVGFAHSRSNCKSASIIVSGVIHSVRGAAARGGTVRWLAAPRRVVVIMRNSSILVWRAPRTGSLAGAAPTTTAGCASVRLVTTSQMCAMASMYSLPNNSSYVSEAPGMPPANGYYAVEPTTPVPGTPVAFGGIGSPSPASRTSSTHILSPRGSFMEGEFGDRRRRDSAMQTLPYTKEFVDEYRRRMKADPDPEAQFAFAMYLIDAAKRVADPRDSAKQARKYRDTLLTDSLRLIKKLATNPVAPGKPPFADAQFFLANCFGNGSLGLPVDHTKAYHLYVQASKQNHPAATYRTAVCNEVGAGTKRNYPRGLLFYRKAASLGDTAGMYKLGMILLHGLLEQPRNAREAIVWLRRAAGQADEDNPHALHELAQLHQDPDGKIAAYNEVYARDLYTQAAQLGYAPSQCKLGEAYASGTLACPVDARASISWYTKAANKGDGNAELALSGWYLTGGEGVLQQSDSEAYLWARRAALKGIVNAEYAVGHYTEVGIGTRIDLEEAKRWYGRAAAQGHARAAQRLADLRQAGGRAPAREGDGDCVVM